MLFMSNSNSNYRIHIEKLEKEYFGRKVLSGISFDVREGEIHALLGHNGAGKTTTMRILAGLTPASKGQALTFGKVGFLPETPPLYHDMRVFDFLHFVGRIHDLPPKTLRTKVLTAADRMGIGELSDRLIGNLSKGQRQRVGIAMVLLYQPRIFILDEPMIGLDPLSLMDLRSVIKDLAQKDGCTILLSTHQLSEVSSICSSLSILNEGTLLFTGSMSELHEKFRPKGPPVLRVQVKEWHDEMSARLTHSFQEIKKITRKKKSESENSPTEVSITSLPSPKAKDDEILKELMSYNCGLLSFSKEEEDIPLEEIYKSLVAKEAPHVLR
jgi:ABC-2 type transport system ATP-binding protein